MHTKFLTLVIQQQSWYECCVAICENFPHKIFVYCVKKLGRKIIATQSYGGALYM